MRAAAAYSESIEIDRWLDNQFHVAQTLHSLANMLSKQGRVEEAAAAYSESIEIGERLKNDNHLAQVLRSYALAIEIRSPDLALELLRRSLDINQRRGNAKFIKLVESTIRQVQERAATRNGGEKS